LQLAAMSRVDIPEDKRRDFYMYVDEFQNFATDSFASILSEARKYRLSITLAHQYIGQLVSNDGNTKVRDAVFGNVGTIISFRVGAADGEFLEKEFMPEFLQNDLVNLAKANIYIKLMIDGVSSKPFSATTVPPHPEPLVSYKDIIIKNSQQHYAVPRKLVEERIASEWQTNSDTAIGEKLERRDEKPLSQVLKPGARVAPQGGQPYARLGADRGGSASTPRVSSGITRVTTPGSSAPRSAAPSSRPTSVASASTTSTAPSSASTPEKVKPIVNATPVDVVVSAPAAIIRPEPAKQFTRKKVDINELRRSINESLKKQAEGDSEKPSE
jgi:hypothetical protein